MLLDIVAIETPSLGDRAYLATDGTVAVVVDPQRDIDRVLAIAAEHNVEITNVFETHIHNDYVTGGLALARATGAAYHVNAADAVRFDRSPVTDGDQVSTGNLTITAIATPGHTYNHLAYALAHKGSTSAVFTGGSLLNGSTGRTDLLGEEHKRELARAQHRSARRLVAELPASTSVCPTHGFGSFCSATPTTSTASTLADELRTNPALTLDLNSYVETTLRALDIYPAYYAHMGPANSAGPGAPDLTAPRPVERGELRRRIDAGEWVVDLRSRVAFAAGHLRGALAFESGNQMITYLGWLIPWGTPITLIGETPAAVAAAQRDLVRIGIDKIRGATTGTAAAWAEGEPLASYPITDFGGYQDVRGHSGIVLLDVRRNSERAAARIDEARHIPLQQLSGRVGELPSGVIWVHCQGGYRAAIAASILDAAGRSVVLINDDFDRAQQLGLAGSGAVPAY